MNYKITIFLLTALSLSGSTVFAQNHSSQRQDSWQWSATTS